MKRLLSLLLNCLLVFAFLMPSSMGTQAQEPVRPATTATQTEQRPTEEAASLQEAGSLAPSQPNPRLEAVRHGKWPAQTASFSGAIQPDRHGPQRNDPSEGIPKHAYSPFDERRNRDYPCPPGGCQFREGQVLVKLAPNVTTRKGLGPMALTTDQALNSALAAQGVVALEPVFPNARPPAVGALAITPDGAAIPMPDLTRWHRAILHDAAADVYAVAESLSRTPGIAWAEPDYLRKPVGQLSPLPRNPLPLSQFWERGRGQGDEVRAFSIPADPLYSQQWYLTAAHVPEAWQWLADHGLPPGGSRDIVVAVIDTGVDLNHPDLAANLWTNSREIPGNGVDDDGDGYVDDVHGVDVIINSGNPMDDHGHGTHVAGIIAAQANNGLGGVGVAYNV
jgi:hypothetical protein